MEGKKRQTSDEKGIRIISVAAFAFAIVSWKATAEGLDAYVFDHGWQSALISFAIQSILFVFNLKLPFYISHIGEIAEERKRRKCHFGDNKGNEKKTYKLTGLQRVIIVFYAVILASSSFFSFVYICNDVVYKHQSGYVDDNAILFSQYREILNDTDDYIRENKKAMQILASIHLGELQQEYPTENNEDGKSLQDLESSRKLAEELFDSAEEEYQNAKDDADKLQEVVQGYEKQRNGTRWHNKQEEWETKYEIANDKWNEAIAKRDKKQEKCDDAKKKFLEADMAVKNYKKPQDSIIAEFLSEMLKVNPQEKILENKISELNDAVISLGENTNIVSNYSDLVKRTQNLTVIVDAYIKLSEAVPNDRTNIEEDGMDTAEEDVNVVEDEMGIVEEKVTDDKENIIVPDPESKDFEQEYTAWKDFWIKKIDELEMLISQLPKFPKNEIEKLKGEETIVDTEILISYDANEKIDDLDELRRNKVSDINVIEGAISLLFGKYCFTAWFSLALALLLDMSSLLAGLFIFGIQKKKA